MENKPAKRRLKTNELVYAALCAAVIAVCSWIQIPATVPFTLQTFAVFLTVGVLGGRLGTLAVSVYIVLGVIGIPVFAGFTGGFGVLAGPTGGYIIGFIFSALVMWFAEKTFGTKKLVLALAMAAGLVVCYAFGTAWFMVVYAGRGNAVSLATALGWCVVPFILPDAMKIFLALQLTKYLKKAVRL